MNLSARDRERYEAADSSPVSGMGSGALVLLLFPPQREALVPPLRQIPEELGAEVRPVPAEARRLDALLTLLEQSSHLLLIADPDSGAAGCTAFALGYAAGAALPTHLFLPDGRLPEGFPRKAPAARSEEELSRLYREEMQRWQAERGRRAAAAALAERGVPATAGGMALSAAAGKMEEIDLFLQAGFSPDTRDAAGVPLLCLAARAGHNDLAVYLLEQGAAVEAVSGDRGNTALMDAAAENNESLVAQLIEAGSPLNVQSKNGQSALILAVGAELTAVASRLLRAGADPDLQDRLGMSARSYARLFRMEELLALMEPEGGSP